MSERKCSASGCSNPSAEKIIVCSGMCSKSAHITCVKISANAFPLFSSRNIKWFCDDCCNVFDKMSQHLEALSTMLQSISSDIKNIKNIPKPDNPASCFEPRVTRQAKKKGQQSEPEGTPTSVHLSSVLLPQNPADKNIIIGSGAAETIGLTSVPVRKYIYASRFSCSTTCEAVKEYLVKTLQIPDGELDCRLLVAANQDVSKFSFISFKVGTTADNYVKLFQPEVWPEGVLVREFVEKPKNLHRPVSMP